MAFRSMDKVVDLAVFLVGVITILSTAQKKNIDSVHILHFKKQPEKSWKKLNKPAKALKLLLYSGEVAWVDDK